MLILGLNAYHGDSAACIVVDGKLVAAAEEERFRRIKHWAGFPAESVRYCLQAAGAGIGDVDHVAVNRDPGANLVQKALFTLRNRPSLRALRDRLKNAGRVRDIQTELAKAFGVSVSDLKARVHAVEHHAAHLAGTFFVSPFDRAAVVSVDGFGDFVSAMWGTGQGNRIQVRDRVFFPHSLGLFYLAITQYLGFLNYGDEYKAMGLASLGKPHHLDKLRKIVRLRPGGRFELALDYFIHHSEGVTMTWDEGEPVIGPVFSPALVSLLGPARGKDDAIEARHLSVVSSLQAMYEEAFFHLLNHVHRQTGSRVLCLAGGCAMNSVANGKIVDRTPFEEVFIQAAAGDAGGALGAAYHMWNQEMRRPRGFVMENACWGPEFSETEIRNILALNAGRLETEGCRVEHEKDVDALCRRTAAEIAAGKVVGWFQGRMEWGPRALGNRSILADPRRAEIQEVLNTRIKWREPFRPFATSILIENVGEYFEKCDPVPFMSMVYPVRPEKMGVIPAVTHVDGTSRLQSVRREDNPLYWRLIRAFQDLTGVPVLLNTSFNENEPIVFRPKEALDCFFRTRMDLLVLGRFLIRKKDGLG